MRYRPGMEALPYIFEEEFWVFLGCVLLCIIILGIFIWVTSLIYKGLKKHLNAKIAGILTATILISGTVLMYNNDYIQDAARIIKAAAIKRVPNVNKANVASRIRAGEDLARIRREIKLSPLSEGIETAINKATTLEELDAQEAAIKKKISNGDEKAILTALKAQKTNDLKNAKANAEFRAKQEAEDAARRKSTEPFHQIADALRNDSPLTPEQIKLIQSEPNTFTKVIARHNKKYPDNPLGPDGTPKNAPQPATTEPKEELEREMLENVPTTDTEAVPKESKAPASSGNEVKPEAAGPNQNELIRDADDCINKMRQDPANARTYSDEFYETYHVADVSDTNSELFKQWQRVNDAEAAAAKRVPANHNVTETPVKPVAGDRKAVDNPSDMPASKPPETLTPQDMLNEVPGKPELRTQESANPVSPEKVPVESTGTVRPTEELPSEPLTANETDSAGNMLIPGLRDNDLARPPKPEVPKKQSPAPKNPNIDLSQQETIKFNEPVKLEHFLEPPIETKVEPDGQIAFDWANKPKSPETPTNAPSPAPKDPNIDLSQQEMIRFHEPIRFDSFLEPPAKVKKLKTDENGNYLIPGIRPSKSKSKPVLNTETPESRFDDPSQLEFSFMKEPSADPGKTTVDPNGQIAFDWANPLKLPETEAIPKNPSPVPRDTATDFSQQLMMKLTPDTPSWEQVFQKPPKLMRDGQYAFDWYKKPRHPLAPLFNLFKRKSPLEKPAPVPKDQLSIDFGFEVPETKPAVKKWWDAITAENAARQAGEQIPYGPYLTPEHNRLFDELSGIPLKNDARGVGYVTLKPEEAALLENVPKDLLPGRYQPTGKIDSFGGKFAPGVGHSSTIETVTDPRWYPSNRPIGSSDIEIPNVTPTRSTSGFEYKIPEANRIDLERELLASPIPGVNLSGNKLTIDPQSITGKPYLTSNSIPTTLGYDLSEGAKNLKSIPAKPALYTLGTGAAAAGTLSAREPLSNWWYGTSQEDVKAHDAEMKKPVIHTTQNADGSVTETNPGGTSVDRKPDGSTVETRTEGNDKVIVTSKDGKVSQKVTEKQDGTTITEKADPNTGEVKVTEDNPSDKMTLKPVGDWASKNVVPDYLNKLPYGHSLFGALAGGAIGAGIGGLNYLMADENELSEEEKKKRSLARAMLSSAGIGAGIGGAVGGVSDFTRS